MTLLDDFRENSGEKHGIFPWTKRVSGWSWWIIKDGGNIQVAWLSGVFFYITVLVMSYMFGIFGELCSERKKDGNLRINYN